MKLLMTRHGQSQWQIEGDSAGFDAPLTTLGEAQAHRLGMYLAQHYTIEAIFASPLKRTRHTSEIVAAYLDLPVTYDDDLREFDEWEAGWAPLPASMWDMSPATEELTPGYSRFRPRVLAAMRRAVEPYPGDKTVLVVAHGGTIGVMLRILFGSDTPRMWLWNASVSLVEWDRPGREGSWILHYFNAMEYLPLSMRTY